MDRWLRALALVVVTTLAIGCGGETERADLVFVAPDEHHFLDPQRMSWLHDIRVAECLFEPLVRVKLPELVVEPAVAERWEISDDTLTYTFHLRPDARWSNGDPVTAHDFVYAWRRALLPDMAADYTQLLFRIAGARAFFNWRSEQLEFLMRARFASPEARRAHIDAMWPQAVEKFEELVGVQAVDDHTLVVRLERPTSYFIELVAFITFVPLHQPSLQAATSIDPETGYLRTDSGYWSNPGRLVSNGPYVLARRRFKIDLLMTQNEHYWNAAAMGNRSILERIISTPQSALIAYDRGEVDWLPEIPTASSLAYDIYRANRPDVHAVPWAGTYFYNFNCSPALLDGTPNPLSDERVRRALSMAIDRQAVVEQVTRLGQPVARTFIPPGSLPNYEPPVDAGARFDPVAARALLAEAGFPNGHGLRGLSILYNTNAGHENIAQLIRHSWEQHLGVSVVLQGLEGKAFSDRLKRHDYTIARAAWIGDYRDPTTFLDKHITGNGNNDAAWSNADYDALLERASHEADAAARMALLQEAEAILLREQPIAPIFHYVTLHVFDPQKVKDLHPNMWNFRRLENIRVER